ncbi:MAG: hypothetical protein J5J06_10690 [Phycisphaerae bacterium]|nr:hypothetical protein [Phycisphaerae bacterium]
MSSMYPVGPILKRLAWCLLLVLAAAGRLDAQENGAPASGGERHPSLYGAKDLRLLYALLVLKDDTLAQDRAIVEALEHADWFTHVVLVTLSWQERPEAVHHPLVRQAVATCRKRGVRVVWGRWLWVAWPDGVSDPPGPSAHRDPSFYVKAIRRLRVEAEELGAVGTFLDVEPYGRCAQKAMKRRDLTDEDRKAIRDAVAQAVQQAGPVDLIYPTSSSRRTHYAWPFAELGLLRMDAKTYYTPRADADLPPIRAPRGFEHRPNLWGVNVGLGRPEDVEGPHKKLTIAQAKALDVEVMKRRFPQCRGVWVYADYDLLPEVLRRWDRDGKP